MKREVIVVDADKNQSESISKLLQGGKIGCIEKKSLTDLREYLATGNCRIILVNLDNLPVDVKFFKNIKAIDPPPFVMGLSSRTSHPELEEAFSHHIDVALKKPLDQTEIFYWLKCFFERVEDKNYNP